MLAADEESSVLLHFDFHKDDQEHIDFLLFRGLCVCY